jgi:hypothetical protein
LSLVDVFDPSEQRQRDFLATFDEDLCVRPHATVAAETRRLKELILGRTGASDGRSREI